VWPIGQFERYSLVGLLEGDRVSSESKEIEFYWCVLNATMVIFRIL
jgi:hypothetical protein